MNQGSDWSMPIIPLAIAYYFGINFPVKNSKPILEPQTFIHESLYQIALNTRSLPSLSRLFMEEIESEPLQKERSLDHEYFRLLYPQPYKSLLGY